MAAQRPPELAPAILAGAGRLPLVDDADDAAMAVLSVHHRDDEQETGVRELRRVARGPVAILTVDAEGGWQAGHVGRARPRGKLTAMDEIFPGLRCWTAIRETIHQPVHSAYAVDARVLVDPMVPPEGFAAFGDGLPAPERIVLTNRHHRRHSARYVERFGCDVVANERGLYDLLDGPVNVKGFAAGDELAPGVVAHEVGVLCPDESAIHFAAGPGALAVADGVIRSHDDGELTFVSDSLLGDEPERIRQGLAAAYRRLCDELEFDVLLMAHGAPVTSGGREALRAFADGVLAQG